MKVLLVLSAVLVSNFASAESLRCVKFRFYGELKVAVANTQNQALSEITVNNKQEQNLAAAECGNTLASLGSCAEINEESLIPGEHDAFGSLPAQKLQLLAKNTLTGARYATQEACLSNLANVAIESAENAVEKVADQAEAKADQEREIWEAFHPNSISQKL